MKRVAIALLVGISLQGVYAAQPECSISPSRQFVIYGADPKVRGAVSSLAEQTKANLLALLRRRDDWKTPVVINLQWQQTNLPEIPPADLRFSQTGFGIKLELDLIISNSLDVSVIERELVRAVLLEMIYRKQTNITAGAVLVEPSDWLIDGVLALAPGRDRGPLVEALANTGTPLALKKFLCQHLDILDSSGRTLYRAYSFALVQMLLTEKDGVARLTQYIDQLSASSNDPLADLQAQFPLLVDNAERTWQLALKGLKCAQTFRVLTFAESERRLDELLCVRISELNKPMKTASLDKLTQHKLSAGEKMALEQLRRDLLFLIPQANPVLRPIAREYETIAGLLAHGKRLGMAKHLLQIEVTRQRLTSRMREIDDYMNWFEATQMKSVSGNFTGYLKAVDQSQLQPPRRRDPLSIYVDVVADHFDN